MIIIIIIIIIIKALFKIWNNRSSLDLLGDMIDSSTSNVCIFI